MLTNSEIVTASILMPGTFHNSESGFIAIYIKTSYRYCILVETGTDTGFEYDEYFIDEEYTPNNPT